MYDSPIPLVRQAPVHFDAPLPRWYAGNNRRRTHLINGMTFVFPAGEQFFIRAVRHYQDRVSHDPKMRARVAGFLGQEAWHQRAHTDSFRALEAQGLELRSFLDWYEGLAYGRLEPMFHPILRLSATAALEHLASTFGELVLSTPITDDVEPPMRDLLRWHSAEEIEHRDVAFDVLQAVSRSYLLRAIGFVVGVVLFMLFWRLGTRHLLRQDPMLSPERDREEKQIIRGFWRQAGPWFLRRVFRYLKPGFHPRQSDTDELAVGVLGVRYGAAPGALG